LRSKTAAKSRLRQVGEVGLDAVKDMLCVSQVHQIETAPANVECVIVEEIDGVTSVRFTNQRTMQAAR
jgi:hypothetical protein